MKGKLKKKTVPTTPSTTIAATSVKTPIKKKISAFVEPRTSKSSRSRASLDEISFLRKQLEQTTKENRTLRQIQRRQDAALARLEGSLFFETRKFYDLHFYPFHSFRNKF